MLVVLRVAASVEGKRTATFGTTTFSNPREAVHVNHVGTDQDLKVVDVLVYEGGGQTGAD